MLPFRYYLLVALAVIILCWPISYLIKCFLYKRRVMKLARNMTSIDDYPIIGCGLRFLGKNNERAFKIFF